MGSSEQESSLKEPYNESVCLANWPARYEQRTALCAGFRLASIRTDGGSHGLSAVGVLG